MISIRVNNTVHQVNNSTEKILLWYLREDLGLTGPKYGCGISQCGACTVLINKKAVRSCSVLVQDLDGAEITTIEGMSGKVADAVFQAWQEEDVPQCGYCQPGQIISAGVLLTNHQNPTKNEILKQMSPVLCRCGTYPRIKKAINNAAGRLSHES
ncbi:MAG: (2Fe-2S)-binding protein [Proteobacteria bacterium]|nr:(2Fe-2S)-binding protein [Pseudomonadota bacterium]